VRFHDLTRPKLVKQVFDRSGWWWTNHNGEFKWSNYRVLRG